MADPTVRDILTAAARKLNVVDLLGTDLEAGEAETCLQTALGAYEELVNAGSFGRMKDVLAESDYTAREYDRVRYTGSIVITIPTTITDRCTGKQRSPYDLSPIIVTKAATAPQISLYDALLGQWVRLDGLTLDSPAPLARRGRDGLACWLAVKIADVFGASIPQATVKGSGLFMAALLSKANSPRVETVAEYF